MKQAKRVTLLFDENFGVQYVGALQSFVACNPHPPSVEVKYFFEMFTPGTPDDEWIPALQGSDVIVVSSDNNRRRGRRKVRGQSLPKLCRAHGVRHVICTGRMSRFSMFDRMRKVLSVWHDLVEIGNAEPGTRYALEIVSLGIGRLSLRPEKTSPKKVQRNLRFDDP